MEVIRARGKALDHKVYEPGQTDAHSTADAAQREAFAQQLLDLSALCGRNAPANGISRKLTAARFTLIILLPTAGMPIFLIPR